MYRSKPTDSKNKTSDNKYLVPVRNHYYHLLEWRKYITNKYGIKTKDKRLKPLINFENNPIINEFGSNKDLNYYEADLVDFIYKCNPDVFEIVAKQFKTKDGYDWGSQFTVKGKVHPSVFWEMLKNYWDKREKQMKIEEGKKEKKAADDRKAEEEKKVAEDEKRQEVRQTPKNIGIKEIQDYVDKCWDQSQTENIDSMLNWWKAYLFV